MKLTIEIEAKYGSPFQKRFANDSLLANLKAWRSFLVLQHKKNEITVEIDGNNIKHLDWIN